MKKKLNQVLRWVSTKGLVWLGFGATPFIFMACYGPVPRNYQETDFAEEIVDSSAVDSLDVAEEAVEGAIETNEEI
jgi:hypothetical protein